MKPYYLFICSYLNSLWRFMHFETKLPCLALTFLKLKLCWCWLLAFGDSASTSTAKKKSNRAHAKKGTVTKMWFYRHNVFWNCVNNSYQAIDSFAYWDLFCNVLVLMSPFWTWTWLTGWSSQELFSSNFNANNKIKRPILCLSFPAILTLDKDFLKSLSPLFTKQKQQQ